MRRLLFYSFKAVYHLKNWLIRRFTAAGWLVLGGAAASAVVGLDTRQTVAYQIFTFLSCLLLISLTCGLFLKKRFTIQRKLPRYGSARVPLSYKITVGNRVDRTQEGLILSEDLETDLPVFTVFQESTEPDAMRRNPFDRAVGYHRWLWLLSRGRKAKVKQTPVPFLPPGGKDEVQVHMVPLSRGRLRLNGVTIAKPDPFGLFHSFTKVEAGGTILILPKRYPLPPMPLPGTRQYQPGGVTLASSVGDSEEFLSLRDYRPGDPLRRIHWKSWAKAGKPIVKENQDEFFVRHALVLDTFAGFPEDRSFEEAVSLAASFACTIQTQESLLDLMFVGTEAYCFTAGRGLASEEKILEILASVQACRDKPFDALTPLVLERVALLSGCICILLKWDPARKNLVDRLEAAGIPILALVIRDPDHRAVSGPGAREDPPDEVHVLEAGKIEEGLAQL